MLKSVVGVSSRLGERNLSTAKKFLLEYHYVPNMLERRIPHREAHLEYTKDFVSRNVLLAGGALLPDAKKGVLLFEAFDKSTVLDFAKTDPYVVHGLVTRYEVNEWAIAAGKL